jgi:hypothetical protein
MNLMCIDCILKNDCNLQEKLIELSEKTPEPFEVWCREFEGENSCLIYSDKECVGCFECAEKNS